MNNTYQILLHWDKGQPFAERMAAKLLGQEGYAEIDPQCPMGGPDGTKDILCAKDGKKFVVGCYFPSGQKGLTVITKKFSNDYEGVSKNKADGFVFITNQKITSSERISLKSKFPSSEIFHSERICNSLDSPKGYGIRLEYLGIELTKAEQISFLNSHLDLKADFDDIKATLNTIRRTSVNLAGLIDARDIKTSTKLSILPIAGIQLSSRISVEDLQALHLAGLYETGLINSSAAQGFRKVEALIGLPGSDLKSSVFLPPPANEVPRRVNELIEWWRGEYMNVLYGTDDEKILAIAQFHERFLSIHPFRDGNGRLARVIASIQYRDLLNQQIAFEEIENSTEYYTALQSAKEGGHQALVDIFLSLAK